MGIANKLLIQGMRNNNKTPYEITQALLKTKELDIWQDLKEAYKNKVFDLVRVLGQLNKYQPELTQERCAEVRIHPISIYACFANRQTQVQEQMIKDGWINYAGLLITYPPPGKLQT